MADVNDLIGSSTTAQEVARLADAYEFAQNRAERDYADEQIDAAQSRLQTFERRNVEAATTLVELGRAQVSDAATLATELQRAQGNTGTVSRAEMEQFQRVQAASREVARRLRLTGEKADWHAEKLADPLGGLSALESRYPGLRAK